MTCSGISGSLRCSAVARRTLVLTWISGPALPVFLALLILSRLGLAQAGGCGLKPFLNNQWSCGTGPCYFYICTYGGDPHNSCYIGFGQCCGQDSQSANTTPDSSCCQPPPNGCPPGTLWINCACGTKPGSPIVIDTKGEGFHLTSVQDGVVFDIAGNGHPRQMAWTSATSGNAFLALDRNRNGKIDDGTELFGNFTAQPTSSEPNGFLALAVFDDPKNGGNGDGIIDNRDAVYSQLRLWIDENHDGVSQPNELYPLSELGVFSIALTYTESRRTDQFGNQFRFKARVNPGPSDSPSKDGRWAYDVFFATLGPPYVPASQVPSRRRVFTGNRCDPDPFLLDYRLDLDLSGFGAGPSSPPAKSDNRRGVK